MIRIKPRKQKQSSVHFFNKPANTDHHPSAMDPPTSCEQLHFVLFPFMAPDPMLDMARLLSQRGATVTLVTPPSSSPPSHHFSEALVKAGINSETLDVSAAASVIGDHQVVELLVKRLTPPPTCIISDVYLHCTGDVAKMLSIPRIEFHACSCFSFLSSKKDVEDLSSYESVGSKKAPMHKTEETSYGAVLNTFEELEPGFVAELKTERQGRVWCIGPVSMCNKDRSYDQGEGEEDNTSVNDVGCLRWLDSQETGSVIYARLGNHCNLTKSQLIELGLGLEVSKRPFVWDISGDDKSKSKSKGLENWFLLDGFEEKNKSNGFILRGCVPQMLILSHPAVGGFLTHCRWNSIIQGISSGVPLITWPLSDDQFLNQKLVVEIVKVGVGVGVDDPTMLRLEEEAEVIVTKDDVKKAIDRLMGDEEDAEEIRERAKQLGEIARNAVQDGGSSHMNTTRLIEQIIQKSD